jgi:UDP-glucose 4-epimerase
MRLLVLGGTGFIGSHVVDQVLLRGHQVLIVSRRPEPFRAPLPNVSYLSVDYRQTEDLRLALRDCDAVLHMVSSTVPATGDEHPRLDVNDNLVAIISLMELMLAEGVRRLVYLSSGGTVYGVPDVVPIPENHPLRPINSYGIVKVAAESYIKLFSRTRGLSSIVLRPSNPYGKRQAKDGKHGLISTILRRALASQSVEIWGDGSIVRDYLHVEDLARLAVMAVESDVTGTFNAGSGQGTSVRELIGLAEEVTGRRLDVNFGPQRSVDVPVSVLDVSNAREVFGWEPEIALREGVARTWEWHLENR